MVGSFSLTGSHPSGGEDGGDIRNCLSGFGGRRYCGELIELVSESIGYKIIATVQIVYYI